MENKKRGSEAALAEIARLTQGISISNMTKLSDQAIKAGGALKAVDGDDDWCGNGRFRFPWPPKKHEFLDFLNVLVQERIDFEALIDGIPVPDEIMLIVNRGGGILRPRG